MTLHVTAVNGVNINSIDNQHHTGTTTSDSEHPHNNNNNSDDDDGRHQTTTRPPQTVTSMRQKGRSSSRAAGLETRHVSSPRCVFFLSLFFCPLLITTTITRTCPKPPRHVEAAVSVPAAPNYHQHHLGLSTTRQHATTINNNISYHEPKVLR
jgi:hypothetical protein